MGLGHSPSIVVDGLVFMIDPNNTNCYSGYGNTVYNLVNSSIGGTFVGYTSNPIDNTENRTIFFDGTNDFIPIGSLGSFYTQGTISFWMKSSDITANYRNPFATNYNGSNVNVIRFEQGEGAGALKCWFGDPSGSIASLNYSAISANTWYNVVLTWNQSTTTVTGYLNGILDVANSSWIRWPTSFANVGIGLGYNSRYFKGNIGQVSIYNRALSATEILQNFNATKKKYSPEENIVTNGLVLNIDPSKNASYSGVGNTVYDLSGFGNTGTLINGPTFSASNSGSIVLDGTNDYITFSNAYASSFGITSNATLSIWAKITRKNQYTSFVGFYNPAAGNRSDFGIDVTSSNTIRLWKNDSQADTGVSFINNKWTNFVIASDSSTVKLYRDTVLLYTGNVSGVINNNRMLAIGYNWDVMINASVSQTLLYNKTLSQQEIQQNYNATKNRFINDLPPVRNGLVLELDAGQRASYPGTGNTWYDVSGNSYNSDLVGSPSFSGIGVSGYISFDANTKSGILNTGVLNNYSSGTIECTIYLTSLASSYIFARQRNGVNSYNVLSVGSYCGITGLATTGTSGKIYYHNKNSQTNLDSTSNILANTWYRIAVTFNNSASTLYINGVQDATIAGDYSVPNDASVDPRIGAWIADSVNRPMNGRLAHFQIFNRALSAYEIKQNFDYYRTRYNI